VSRSRRGAPGRLRVLGSGPALVATLAVALAAAAVPARAAISRVPGDYRPVAAEGTSRAAWVNPSGIGSGGKQYLMVEGQWEEDGDGRLLGRLATLTVSASTDRTAYLFQKELDDHPGVADWTLLAAKRMPRKHGFDLGSAVEYRSGESRTVDATVAVTRPLGAGLKACLVVEDLFAADVDEEPGSRHWRGGLGLRPAGGGAFLTWDYDRLERDDEGRHWFAVGLDRGRGVVFRVAANDEGDWSLRIGVAARAARLEGAILHTSWGTRSFVDSGAAASLRSRFLSASRTRRNAWSVSE